MKTENQILKLLTPSWLVNFVALASGVLVTAGVIVASLYSGSALRFQIFDVQSRSIVDKQQGIYANITLEAGDNSFLGALPLLITWACIGLLVYFFAASLMKSISKVAVVREQLDYVNASRQQIIREALIALAVRVAATTGWFLFIKLSIAYIVPYALASASAAAAGLSIAAVGYVLMAVIVLYVDVVMHAIFLRLVVLKPRLWDR
jgi:hypothetical protein